MKQPLYNIRDIMLKTQNKRIRWWQMLPQSGHQQASASPFAPSRGSLKRMPSRAGATFDQDETTLCKRLRWLRHGWFDFKMSKDPRRQNNVSQINYSSVCTRIHDPASCCVHTLVWFSNWKKYFQEVVTEFVLSRAPLLTQIAGGGEEIVSKKPLSMRAQN